MNKKLLVVSILAVLMLLAISFSTAVSSNTTTDEKRESPLFRVRTRRAIGERLDELKEAIKAKFIGERVFFLPFQLIRNKIHDDSMASIIFVTCLINPCTWEQICYTCAGSCSTYEKECTINQYTCFLNR